MTDQTAPTDQLALRPATPEEIPALLALWARAAKGTSITDDEAGVAALLARDPECLIVATPADDPTALLGTVIAGWDGWRCHLYRLAVDPGHRRRGIGAALLAAAEERFAALGGRRADAMVLDDNALGHRTWQSAGYEPQPQWSRWVKPLPA
ncbi:ribosomal protein S18 acetylase RimI-like enzyme [Streptomyces sp. 1114.5]|uniref:GNAT family N-acetyltransferase n=1 Tax=unclassified Streptomyces TaxID=2593676 RepID=UPI000BDA6771|nr:MULTISPECIES: GNAT family N-acetyltransferase [unclassified Streptomyces]RKT19538.1 ribosomal protein S18 acetylase RimI-like enzyme [Streptomyces sp. 1114.5]SOB85735.1 Ribosomal protein S18 acetylase RimI [Streptomyces sp. 1331.2]